MPFIILYRMSDAKAHVNTMNDEHGYTIECKTEADAEAAAEKHYFIKFQQYEIVELNI